MASQLYICPVCGCPDLEVATSALKLPPDARKVSCPNCKWTDVLTKAAGIMTTEKVFDTNAVSSLLLHVVMRHGAGPIAQALQFIGLLKPGDQKGLNHVMRAAIAGLIEAAFSAASEHAAAEKEGGSGETSLDAADTDPAATILAPPDMPEEREFSMRKSSPPTGDSNG